MDEALTVPAPGGRWAPVRLLGDERLAQLAANGDQNAFAEIYRRYHQELYRYCRAILHCHEEAQDALQDTMVNILRALPGESRTVALRPWLYRVAHNEAITLVRRRAATVPEEEVPEQPDPRAENRTEHRERLRQLLADLDALPDRQRGALTMRELSGMTYAEIGASLGLSDAAARQAVYEARVALQELAEGRDMECETARQALSSEDRRVLRGRKLRAHLRACAGCQGFKASIESRRAELAALAPPLPAVAAAGLLQAALSSGGAVLGGGATAGAAAAGGAAAGGASAGNGLFGLLGGGVANGVAGSTAAKSVAAAVAAGAIGAGAGGAADVANVPLVGDSTAAKEATPSGAPPGVQPGLGGPASGSSPGGSQSTGGGKARGNGARGQSGKAHGRGKGGEHGAKQGQGAAKAGKGKAPAAAPGQGSAAPRFSPAPPAKAGGPPAPPPHAAGKGGAAAQGGGPPPSGGGPQSSSQGSASGRGPPANSSGSPGGRSSPPGHAPGGSAAAPASAAASQGGPPAQAAASSGAPGQGGSDRPGHAKK